MADNNVHRNHRQRMFARFDKTGFSGFSEYEILEMLLYYTISDRNTNDIAHRLLDKFRSLNGVLSAPEDRLVKVEGVGIKTARYLRLWNEAFKKLDEVPLPTSFNSGAMRGYLKQLFKDKTREEVYLLCLDPQDNILDCSMINEGNFESAGVDMNKIMRITIENNCNQVVLVHNHPSGIAMASDADINVTKTIGIGMKMFGIKLRDHIIVAGDKLVSIVGTNKLSFDK